MPEPDWYTKTNKARLGARQDLADALDGFAAALSGTAGETPGNHRELAQGAVARFAPGLAPLGALENAAIDSPRAAEMVFRSSDQLKKLGQALGLGGGR